MLKDQVVLLDREKRQVKVQLKEERKRAADAQKDLYSKRRNQESKRGNKPSKTGNWTSKARDEESND